LSVGGVGSPNGLGIEKLIAEYGRDNVDFALGEAHRRGNPTINYVIGILRKRKDEAVPISLPPTPTLPKDLTTDEELEAAGYIPPSKAKAISDAAWERKYGSAHSIRTTGPVTV
jgi:hypothetical protein